MSQPQRSSVHIDAALTNFSYLLTNESEAFIYSKVFPRVKVAKPSDKYFIYGPENLFVEDGSRAPGTLHKRTSYTLSNTAYYCEQISFEQAIPDENRDAADPALDLRKDAVAHLTEKVDLNLENRFATLLTNYDNYASSNRITLTPSKQWSNYSSTDSDPLADIKAAKRAVFAGLLRPANFIILSYSVAEVLSAHPSLIEMRKYTSPDLLGDFGLPKKIDGLDVYIAVAGYNTAKRGKAAALAEIWGDSVVIGYCPKTAGLRTPSFGVIFDYKGRVVESYREEQTSSEIVRVREQGVAEVILSNVGGYIIADTLA